MHFEYASKESSKTEPPDLEEDHATRCQGDPESVQSAQIKLEGISYK